MSNFRVSEPVYYPEDEPLTQAEYDRGLRDPHWLGILVVEHSSAPNCPYYPKSFLETWEFPTWCRANNIEVDYVYYGTHTEIHGSIQHERQALEAKLRFC